MTASAWTPTSAPTSTPLPTATPTPIPYALSVKVTNEDGNPVASASVTLDKSESVLTDENGMASWANLDVPDGSMNVAASGYFTSEQTFSLSRGLNEMIIALERDPNGLPASLACAPGESPLYVEDFQDGNAQGMDVVNFNAGGWSIGSAPDLAENLVMTLALPDSYGGRVSDNEQAGVTEAFPENAVWRFNIQITGPGTYVFFWQRTEVPYQSGAGQVDWSRYMIHLGTAAGGRGDRASAVIREQPPLVPFVIANRIVEYLRSDVWTFVEISTFEGNVKVWLNGKETSDYVDPQPMPGGGFGIGTEMVKSGAIAYYDNMSVCGLSAPFTSLYVVP
ncbi:MAG: hypothetical protein HYZ24_12845 [Chloroflexi bacterium]|nr:hypothetical protein [Chloroflexota bacterium]